MLKFGLTGLQTSREGPVDGLHGPVDHGLGRNFRLRAAAPGPGRGEPGSNQNSDYGGDEGNDVHAVEVSQGV